jgi:hypothetical protein
VIDFEKISAIKSQVIDFEWVKGLLEHMIDFEKRSDIKSQVLADFIADWMEPASYTEGSILESPWHVYYDGASGNTRAGASVILISPSGIKLKYDAVLLGPQNL